MNMKLIGAPTIKDVVPSMVDTRSLNPGNAPDTMFEANCESPFPGLARGSVNALTS